MKTFTDFKNQETLITKSDLNKLEKILDKLFADCGIDINFTKHFLDRVNDGRNKKQITFFELQKIFRNAYGRYCDVFSKMKNVEAILRDMQTNINIPFVLKWNNRDKMLDLVAKTVMRKKDFKTRDRKFNV